MILNKNNFKNISRASFNRNNLSHLIKRKYDLINISSKKISISASALTQFQIPRESNLKGFINHMRKNSYKYAKIDPLGISNKKQTEDLNPSFWELSQIEKITDFPIDNSPSFTKTLLNKNTTILDLENYLQNVYLSTTGVEFDHIDCGEEKAWLYEFYEDLITTEQSPMELVNAFKILYPADLFEKFLHSKFPTFKRYSGEGCNTLLVALYSILSECSKNSSPVSSTILSMPHRGRLNVLPLVIDYPVAYLFKKIQGGRDIPTEIEGIDDVVSHVATSNNKLFCLDGDIGSYKPISISILHNPSHLEAIYPVGMGKAYAKIQDLREEAAVMNITIHGDSAVSAQGLIYETLSFHKSPNCDLGGTLHIVTNNQIGYTTQNENCRSSQHCTDIFKPYSIPIVHVSADDTSRILKVGKFAYMYRNKFKKDFVINLIGWRKFGHNEVDEPTYSQPLMYKVIKNKQETVDNLKLFLLNNKHITEENIKSLNEKYLKLFNEELERSKSLELKLQDVRNEKFKGNKTLVGKWVNMNFPQFCAKDSDLVTGLNNIEIIREILTASVRSTCKPGFSVHPRLIKYFINSRISQLDKGLVDWPGAEIAAFGSLLGEGFNVRISGQDVTRGTFSQRHLGLVDQETGEVYIPLSDKSNFPTPSASRLEVNNSSLSELGVMLFEYGYSLESPKNCVVWEAQFGDFVNGAQIAQDQFIASGEKKWMRQSGIILLLPHGFDGTGPEHSSSKIERFLQLTDSNGIDPENLEPLVDHRGINMCVAQPTKPSNYFHLLRRQMLRSYRKPLIVITPKIGLKHISYSSSIEEFLKDNKFTPIIVDKYNNDDVHRDLNGVIFCSGQIFMELKNQADILIKEGKKVKYITVRIEELAPFPEKEILDVLNGNLNSLAKFYWIQEESMNMGCYSYVAPFLRRIMSILKLKSSEISYIGRNSQVGANGCLINHKLESNKLNSEIIKLLSI